MRFFSSYNFAVNSAITSLGVFALTLGSAAHAQMVTDYLYVTDYGSSNLDRYSFTFNEATNTITSPFTPDGASSGSAVLINGNVKEGLVGTSDDLIVVEGTGSTIGRYMLNGTKIADIAVTGFPPGITGFGGVGNVAITSNGQYMYAPDESKGYIYEINLSTGKIVNYVQMTNVHDVAIGSDGTIYAGAYSSSQGIKIFTSSLSLINTLVPTSTLSNTTGIALQTNSSGQTTGLYVMSHPVAGSGSSTTAQGPDTVNNFALSGSGVNETATLVSDPSYSALKFSFGDAIGPDGNLYSAELGANGYGNTNYTGGIYEYNTTTGNVSVAVQGYTEGTDSLGSGATGENGGLNIPKYLEFSTSFINAPDAGLVPEPGSMAMLAGFVLSGMGFLVRRKLRK